MNALRGKSPKPRTRVWIACWTQSMRTSGSFLICSVRWRTTARSQRRIAAELGIALGLVNAYLKRCVKKGLGQGQRRAGAPLCLLPDAARFRRKIPAHGGVPLITRFRFSGWPKLIARGSFNWRRSGISRNLVLCRKVGSCRDRHSFRGGLRRSRSSRLSIRMPTRRHLSESRSLSGYDRLTVPVDAVIITDVINAQGPSTKPCGFTDADRVLAPSLLGLKPPSRRDAAQ